MIKQLQKIIQLKEKLDSFRPFPPALIKHLTEWYKIELTYTSNAIEGNSLNAHETAIVVEKGLAIGGKTIREHLEAINHAEAFSYIVNLAQESKNDITLRDILTIHRLILRRIDDDNAGRWRTILVKISGLEKSLPDPIKVPELMDDFIQWLHATTEHPAIIAADAHFKLVTIHPFVDGNGRTARLLMNLLLMQAGYPPAIIKPQQRKEYIDALALGQTKGDMESFYRLILQSVEQSLEMYLHHVEKSQ